MDMGTLAGYLEQALHWAVDSCLDLGLVEVRTSNLPPCLHFAIYPLPSRHTFLFTYPTHRPHNLISMSSLAKPTPSSLAVAWSCPSCFPPPPHSTKSSSPMAVLLPAQSCLSSSLVSMASSPSYDGLSLPWPSLPAWHSGPTRHSTCSWIWHLPLRSSFS